MSVNHVIISENVYFFFLVIFKLRLAALEVHRFL